MYCIWEKIMANSRFQKFKQETMENSVYTQSETSRMAFIKKVYAYLLTFFHFLLSTCSTKFMNK